MLLWVVLATLGPSAPHPPEGARWRPRGGERAEDECPAPRRQLWGCLAAGLRRRAPHVLARVGSSTHLYFAFAGFRVPEALYQPSPTPKRFSGAAVAPRGLTATSSEQLPIGLPPPALHRGSSHGRPTRWTRSRGQARPKAALVTSTRPGGGLEGRESSQTNPLTFKSPRFLILVSFHDIVQQTLNT